MVLRGAWGADRDLDMDPSEVSHLRLRMRKHMLGFVWFLSLEL